MATNKNNIISRSLLIASVMVLFLISIVVRVINLQYINGEELKKLATELTIKQDTVYANRGNIYSSEGSLLAISVSKFNIYVDLKSINQKVFDKNVDALSSELSKLLKKPKNYYLSRLKRAKKMNKRYFPITKNLGYIDYLKMKSFPIFSLGIYKGGFIAAQKPVREHPFGKIAERTIGYKNYRGSVGIEGAYKGYLQGENGLRWKQKIAKGQWKPISDMNEKEPNNGQDVITTININFQDITHHALLKQLKYFEADHGCAVIMEVATGEIKAIANLGRGKENTFSEKRNYAIWESHEPGSTFKTASFLAALDDNLIDTATVVDTEKGKIYIHGKKIEDSKKGGYGEISAARSLEVSSNIGVVKLIRKHYDKNPQKFIDKVTKYGFSNEIGLPIKGEGIPVIPNPKQKGWNKISLEWMSWGYGVSVTPMQTLMFYNAIANDGKMVKPKFVKALKRLNRTEKIFPTVVVNKKIASGKALKKIKKILENVVIKGTAKNIYTPNFSMAGKTGTAKKFIPTHIKNGKKIIGHYSNKEYTASFTGFFPVDNPKYSCIVVIHNPKKEKGYYGATVAAPVFKEIAQKVHISTPETIKIKIKKTEFKSIIKSYEKYTDYEGNNATKVPNVIGMSAMDALSLLENRGLKVKISGIGKVKKQSLKKGQKIKKGSVITLKLS